MDAPAVDGFIEQDARARRLVAGDSRQPAYVAGGAFEIVRMAVQLPDKDGFGAANAIGERKHTTGRHARSVPMTAHVTTGDNGGSLAAGKHGSFSKPIDPRSLYALVEA